ncbi:MAG: LuxR C-terminal-related transcriptional regulator [Pseudomonadota bacterium]
MSIALHEAGVGETVRQLSHLERLSDVRESVFEPLAHAFDAESMVAFRQRMDGPRHCLRPVAALNQARDVLSHYLTKVSSLDPSMPYWRSVAYNAQSVWSYSDVMRQAKTANPKRFDRFLNERANVSHMLMMSFNLGADGNDSMLFALHRAPGREDFTQDERQTAANVAPLMRQIFRALAAADVETMPSAVARSVLERPGGACQALVDIDGRVICGDDEATHALASFPPKEWAALKRGLADLQTKVILGDVEAQAAPLGTFLGRSVDALPVDQSGQRFVLTVSPADSEDAHAFSALTPRQAEVAELVANGCRNWQVAQLLTISENTVVNHLAAIYDTLAIGGRMELALLWKNSKRQH